MDLLELENLIVDEKYGIVSDISNIESIFGLPFIYRKIANVQIKNISKYYDVSGYGYAFDDKYAKTKALGEALERYTGAIQIKSDCKASYVNLKNDLSIATNLDAFFNSELYLSNNMNIKTIDWTLCRGLHNNEHKLFPSFWINYPCYDGNNDYSYFGSTSGMAVAMSKENAIDNAVCECLERDICANFWVNNKPIYELDFTQLDHINKKIIYNFANCGFKIDLYYITNKWDVPCYAAKITNVELQRFSKRPLNYMVAKVGNGCNRHIYSLLGELIGGYYSLMEICQDSDYLLSVGNNIAIQNALHFSKNKILINSIGKCNLKTLDIPVLQKVIRDCIPIYVKNIASSDLNSMGIHAYKAISTKLKRFHDGYLYGDGVIKNEKKYPFI